MILLLVKHNAFSVGRHHHYCHCIALLREWKNKRDKEHTHTTLEERALAQTFLSVDIIISESALSWKPQCSNTQFRSTSIFFYFKTFKNFLPDINSPVNHYSHRHFHSAQNCKCFRVCVCVHLCATLPSKYTSCQCFSYLQENCLRQNNNNHTLHSHLEGMMMQTKAYTGWSSKQPGSFV